MSGSRVAIIGYGMLNHVLSDKMVAVAQSNLIRVKIRLDRLRSFRDGIRRLCHFLSLFQVSEITTMVHEPEHIRVTYNEVHNIIRDSAKKIQEFKPDMLIAIGDQLFLSVNCYRHTHDMLGGTQVEGK